MSNDVLMPQMGESIVEGTVVRWMKRVGETVDRDEPLFEISTDKVDAEIPSPAAGVLLQIRVEVGETAPVNSVVAVIGERGEVAQMLPVPSDRPLDEVVQSAGSGPEGLVPDAAPNASRWLSPVVRRLALEHNIDLSAIVGTGDGGRVTKSDVLAYVGAQGERRSSSGRTQAVRAIAAGDRVEPMSSMRQRIAERMVDSRRQSAHAHTVFEVDFTAVAALRAARPMEEPTPAYLAYIVKAVCDALVAIPVVNASVDGKQVIYHKRVNIGVAVALDSGLIVPVVQQADRLGVDEIDGAIKDLASRARSKQLSPENVNGGTFTVTNPGGFGSLLGMPIINQPQAAILCVGVIENRPVVVDGAVIARLRAFLTLGFDHRLIDGAIADQFVSHVKTTLEVGFGPSGDR